MTQDASRHGDPEDVGSVSDEAAKLLGVLGEWAKEHGGTYADAASAGASGLGDALRDLDQHVATGAEECRYCPVCVVVGKVRSTSPEIREHLSSAATSLLAAVAGMLATPVPEDATRRGPVEKIDLGPAEDLDDLDDLDGLDAEHDLHDTAGHGARRARTRYEAEGAEPFEDLLGPTRPRRSRRPATDEEEPQ